jgi:hypothetical protein
MLSDHRRCNLHLEIVAVFPQLLGRSRILEQNSIDVEGVELAGTEAIDGLTNTGDEISQLGLVILRDQRARCSPLRPV